MPDFPPLKTLGRRIMVLGPTNSGKSTLAEAIGVHLGIPAVHLDQFRHLPGTNWQQRPDDEFQVLHDEAVAMDAWVMDGSYSKIMAPRLARTTGMIVLDDTLFVRTLRYFRRTLFQKRRPGGLDGNRDSVKWDMLVWLWKTRDKSGDARRLARDTGLPHVFVHDRSELDALYAAWKLTPATA
jgi:adenylate kinase family enzyme